MTKNHENYLIFCHDAFSINCFSKSASKFLEMVVPISYIGTQDTMRT